MILNKTLRFVCDDSEGEFIEPDTEDWYACYEDMIEIHETSLYIEDCIAGYQYLINQEPDFLDAYAHIGGEYLDDGNQKEAEKYYQKGLDIAMAIIPKGFSGTIQWGAMNNRPFLRLHHGYILCQLKKGKIKYAIELMEQHLKWNPNDNIGVRFLVEAACKKAGITHFRYNNSIQKSGLP